MARQFVEIFDLAVKPIANAKECQSNLSARSALLSK